jgi:hypothetical protein
MAARKKDEARMNDLALDVVVARKYGEVLHQALGNMRAATERHGAPTAKELIEAIEFALDKANAESMQVGRDFLAERKRQDIPQITAEDFGSRD